MEKKVLRESFWTFIAVTKWSRSHSCKCLLIHPWRWFSLRFWGWPLTSERI